VIVVDQGDLSVAHVDVAGHLNERRFSGRYNAERFTNRAPVTRHHLVE